MVKVKVHRAEAFEGPAVQYVGDDGYPAGHIVPVLLAHSVDGVLYQRPNSFKVDYDEEGFQVAKVGFDLAKARDMADVIRDRGYIDAEHWVAVSKEDFKEYLAGSYGG